MQYDTGNRCSSTNVLLTWSCVDWPEMRLYRHLQKHFIRQQTYPSVRPPNSAANLIEKSNIPCLVMASVSDKNVNEVMKFAVQLMHVVTDVPVLRAHSGYISALIVQGIGAIPAVHYPGFLAHSKYQIQWLLRTYIGGFEAPKLSMKSHILQSVYHMLHMFSYFTWYFI